MGVHAKAAAKAKSQAATRAKAKAKVKSKAQSAARRTRLQQWSSANDRQKRRRQALAEMNAVAVELNVAACPLVLQHISCEQVEQRVRLLQRRCADADILARLRSAAALYVENGGMFSAPVVGEEEAKETPLVKKHKVLHGVFRLCSSAFMLTYHSVDFSEMQWPQFRRFIKDLGARLGCRAWAACLERGATAETHERFHFHAYFYWNDGHGVDLDSTDVFVFSEVRPRVDVRTKCAPMAMKVAAYHGLWYVSVMKLGTVNTATNFHAWRDYTPLASWIDGLWAAKKLSAAQAMGLAREIGVGYAQRKRDAQEVMRDEKEASIRAHIAKEMQDLTQLPQRAIPEVDKFVSFFEGRGRWRRPMLALLAATNLGKSMLAEHVLLRVASALGVPSFLEVTVEADEHMDLSEYDHNAHAGVLLDGVGDVLFLKKNREILQGRPKATKGGKSATNMYAYPYTLCRRAVVVTMDLSVANMDALFTDHWLSNENNLILLKLDEPAWIGGPPGQPSTPGSPYTTMAGWSTAELMSFLVRKDLAGPARILHSNGVNGADLLDIAEPTLTEDLRMSCFAARKVLSARDAYLQSP